MLFADAGNTFKNVQPIPVGRTWCGTRVPGFASRRPWRQSASISGFRAASGRPGSAGTFQSARCSGDSRSAWHSLPQRGRPGVSSIAGSHRFATIPPAASNSATHATLAWEKPGCTAGFSRTFLAPKAVGCLQRPRSGRRLSPQRKQTVESTLLNCVTRQDRPRAADGCLYFGSAMRIHALSIEQCSTSCATLARPARLLSSGPAVHWSDLQLRLRASLRRLRVFERRADNSKWMRQNRPFSRSTTS